MDLSYWKKQTAQEPLFPDIAWSKPEQRSFAGRLGIVGGNKLGFAGVAEAYRIAHETGVGEARVLLPDALKKSIPKAMTDVIYAGSNPSGSLAREAFTELQVLGQWAESMLLIGDAGRSSETAILYEDFIRAYEGQLVITRDAIDLIKNSPEAILERPQTVLVASFAQLQKLFQSVYYPKVLTFSMHLAQFVEAVHKFTLTYPVTLVVLHKDTLVIAHQGDVITTPWEQPILIWRGTVAAQAACYWLWNPKKPAQAIATSLLE